MMQELYNAACADNTSINCLDSEEPVLTAGTYRMNGDADWWELADGFNF